MAAGTTFRLKDHGKILMEMISESYSSKSIDTKLILKDGVLSTHSIVLSAMSPFLEDLLIQAEAGNFDGKEELHTLHLPDIPKQDMELILTLLYRGTANIYHEELERVISLTTLLKMVSIPVAVIEEPWTLRTEIQPKSKQHFLKTAMNYGPSTSNDQRTRLMNEVSINLDTVTPLMTLVDCSNLSPELRFTAASHQETSTSSVCRLREKENSNFCSDQLSESEDIVEEIKVYVSGDGEVEKMEVINKMNGEATEFQEKKENAVSEKKDPGNIVRPDGERVTLIHAEEGDGLESLISVAEAFEKTQQPDFNDITSPVIDGTDTERELVKTCVLCSKSLLGRNALGRHMKNAHPAVFGPYDCPWPGCGRVIESGMKVIHHMTCHTIQRGDEETTNVCSTCNIAFESRIKLNEHTIRVHNGEKSSSYKAIFVCSAENSSCKKIFSAARHFINHMKIVHKLKPWRCEVCSKRFSDKQNFQNHSLSHGEKKNFTCDICTKVFNNPRQLYAHRSLHLGRRFLCQKCGYKARSSANLRGHVRTMHEERSFTCKNCQKKFSSGSNLKDHMRIHTGETPYSCKICEVYFKRRHHLNGHIESKAHVELLQKCRREGIKVPDGLDPNQRRRGVKLVEDGPVTIVTQSTFEANIADASQDQVVLEGEIQSNPEQIWLR